MKGLSRIWKGQNVKVSEISNERKKLRQRGMRLLNKKRAHGNQMLLLGNLKEELDNKQ